MYTPQMLGRYPIVSFEDTITRPDRLIDHIEELDANTLSHTSIMKWQDNIKEIHSWAKNEDITLNRKILYVKNSFLASSMFCFTQYSEAFKLKTINNSNSFVLNKADNKNDNIQNLLKLDDNNTKFYCFTFLNDNYVGGNFSFPNFKINIKPKSGSMLVFPKSDIFEWKIDPITQGVAYRALIIGLSESAMV